MYVLRYIGHIVFIFYCAYCGLKFYTVDALKKLKCTLP